MNPAGVQRVGFPRPQRDQDLYQKTLAKGFELFPERQKNFEKYKSAKRGELVDHLPIIMDVENVSRCNFRCTMCEVSTWEKGRRAEDMPLADFKRLLEEQIGLIEIKIQGLGEPTMGEGYFEMIRLARMRQLWVRSTTNASLLHHKKNAESYVESDICELQISVDGVSKNSYEGIRKGGKYDLMMRNIQRLHDLWRQQGIPRTRMWTVLQRDNFHEWREFPRFAADLGFQRCTLALDLNDFGQESWKKINDPKDVHGKFTAEMAEQAMEVGQKNGVEVTFWYLDEKFSFESPKSLCPWPFERLMVSSDMKIVPCCMISNPNIANLGDARKLDTEWNGSLYKEFRKKHLSGNIPNYCESCYRR